jgi:hypothetical protein
MLIKRFENFENIDYYQELSQDEYESTQTQFIDVEDSVVNMMKNHIKNPSIELSIDTFTIADEFENNLNWKEYLKLEFNKSNLGYKYSYKDINIFQNFDEFFFVEIHDRESIMDSETKYFKCDQIEGLLKCLEDNEMI